MARKVYDLGDQQKLKELLDDFDRSIRSQNQARMYILILQIDDLRSKMEREALIVND